jgi:hypothetical protein
MRGWNSKGKRESGSCNRITVFWLKKHGYLDREYSYKSGGIKWTWGWGNENSIGFTVVRDNWGQPNETTYIKLNYTNTNRDGEKENMNYDVRLATTPCRFGGERYWFICPLTKNGTYCGKRVGALYGIGKWFGCRHCADIIYSSQKLSGRYKGFVSIPDLDRAEAEVKRYYYRGKPTRKYRKLLRLEEKFEIGISEMYLRLGKKLKLFKNPEDRV